MRDKGGGGGVDSEENGRVLPLKTVLTNLFNRLESMEEETFEREFSDLKSFSEELKTREEFGTREGEKDVNRKKNRYKDILPFDYTRVILSEYPGVSGSDYINANYMKGASGSNAYIASQGPLPNTLNDFWRMIVECQVQVIVMACNEQEAGKHKCERYWGTESQEENHNEEEEEEEEEDKCPQTLERQYGNYFVKLLKARRLCPDFLVRTMRLRWQNESGVEEEKIVCQFHYSAWPDHGIPTQVKPLLEMVRLIRDCQASETLPVLVHCSAGCGRTGTICAIDFIWGLLRTGKLTSNFSLFELVKEMRKQRIAIVQTVDQYILVHRAVRELFLEQLRVIDTHTYENVDNNGLPIYRSSNNIAGDESDTEYETVCVNEQNIDKILSEKLNTNLSLSSSSTANLYNTKTPPKQRYLESLNLESRNNVGTSASATTSTANSSDNLLEEFHRDISKSTSKLFEPAAPPESLRNTSASQRFKKGNLRLKQTDDGHWIIEERDIPLDSKIKTKKPHRKKSNEINAEAPPLLRKPSMKKIKAFFNKNEASQCSSDSPRFEEDPPSPSNQVTHPHRLSELEVSLVSGSKSVPNSLDRKVVRKSTSTLKNLDSDQSMSSIISSSESKIKRSKSMKITLNSSNTDHFVSSRNSKTLSSSYDSPPPSPIHVRPTNKSPPPKSKPLSVHEYANVHFSLCGGSSEINLQSGESVKMKEFREFVSNNQIVPLVHSPLKPKRTPEYVNVNFSNDEGLTSAITDSVMASFESAEKEGDKTLSDFNNERDSVSSNISTKFAPFLRLKERRNSFRQAVDSRSSWSSHTTPTYENVSVMSDEFGLISNSSSHHYEPISYGNEVDKSINNLISNSKNIASESTNVNSLQSVGLVSEVIKQQQQPGRSVIRKHSSSNSLLGAPGSKGSPPPPPPYKQPPSLAEYQQPKRSSSVSRIPHRHLPSTSRITASHHLESRVPPIHLNQIPNLMSVSSLSTPPKLPVKENKVISQQRRVTKESVSAVTTNSLPKTMLNTSYSADQFNHSSNASPHGIDLDVVAAMMSGGAGRVMTHSSNTIYHSDLSKPNFGRSLAGVLSGAATNFRSRFLGSSSPDSAPSFLLRDKGASIPGVAGKQGVESIITTTHSPAPPSHKGMMDESGEMPSSSIPLTVPGASSSSIPSAPRHLGVCGFPDTAHALRSREPSQPPKNFIRKQEYL
ncbi:uncharacterized protein [Lepeophtheirus salmonis]|uniref:uncharacterized protein isoform X1 n=1 Tax=Lepeophtheirus salmonis TaxID=72036 RepID=UPI001AEB305A|nr:uncharacterized protein LOC121127511 isoform X1 [Lepeophtheirus salmonis]